ncbi:MAG: hypothetical protein DI626_10605 [Micavibrio aeruginosavorus]|uniref:Uncharacterized protein n=1 Tax=Micavibrio aeruginosavorus TaxID=349221 RepID=A0A2W4ZH60_9BACT|nr:MAG: hypothetical protein DI626_10605 [Micavibrio aeruginosavorus]
MSENPDYDDTKIYGSLQPIAASVAKRSLSNIVENSIKAIEAEHLDLFISVEKRPMNEHEKTYLRKLVLKQCREYLSSAIETIEFYQKT